MKKVQKLCDSQQNHGIESLQVCMCPQKSNWLVFHPGQGRIHPNVNAGAKCTLKFSLAKNGAFNNSSIRWGKVWHYRRISWKWLHQWIKINSQRQLNLTMHNLSNLPCLMKTLFTFKKTSPTWLHPACKELALLSQHPWILLHLISCTEQVKNKFICFWQKTGGISFLQHLSQHHFFRW